MSQTIIIAGWVDVDPSVRDQLVAATAPLQAATRDDEPGCLAYVISADPVVPERIQIYECWASADDLETHFRHPNFFATGDVLRSQPRLGGGATKYRIDATGPVRGPDGQATAQFLPDAD
jgi:quinol monooxygenase YgiN